MNYAVITDNELKDLVERVNEKIAEGWQPLGGIAITSLTNDMLNEHYLVYAQAMIKPKELTLTYSVTSKKATEG